MAEVGVAAEGAGPDRDLLVVRVSGAYQVIGGEADHPLNVVVALDNDIGVPPAGSPGRFMPS
jgi:hypothetical protein